MFHNESDESNLISSSDDEIKTKKDKELDLKLVCYKCYLKLKGAVYDARCGFEWSNMERKKIFNQINKWKKSVSLIFHTCFYSMK